MPLPVLDEPTYETVSASNNKPVRSRPFLVKEHKVLLMLKEADNREIHRVVCDVIENCTFHKIKAQELAFFDLVHMFIELRKVSIGENLELVINCECGTRIETEVNLTNVKTDRSANHTSRIELTKSIYIDLRYPNLYEGLEAYTTNDVEKTLEVLGKCIVGIHQDNEFHDTRESTAEEIREFLENLNTKQLEKLMTFFVTMPRVYLDIVKDCPNCNKHHDLKLEGLDHFFV